MQIESVQSLLEFIKTLKNTYGKKTEYGGLGYIRPTVDFYYRGIKNISFPLCPRAINNDLCQVEYENFDQPLELFKKEASGYLRNKCGNDNLMWMQYAQHFSVPTRLLDFSTNPLVSLYFACEDNNVDGVLWIMNEYNYTYNAHKQFMNQRAEEDPPKGGVATLSISEYFDIVFDPCNTKNVFPVFFVPEYIDARMNAQSSRFLLWPCSRFTLEEKIQKVNYMTFDEPVSNEEYIKKYAYRITVPKERKINLLHELDMLGINKKTLFPGLDSIGEYIDQSFNPKFQS